jgi:hypothetical protein
MQGLGVATIQIEVNVMDLPEVKELTRAFNERCKELQRDLDLMREKAGHQRDLLMEAAAWMAKDGCDCGTDEPGTCGLCRIQKALEDA